MLLRKWSGRLPGIKQNPSLNGFFNKPLASMLELMIYSKKAVVEYRTGKDYSGKTLSGTVASQGGGVTLEPEETINGNIEIVIDPENILSSLNEVTLAKRNDGKIIAAGNLHLNQPITIVHEFGHAFANMMGFTSANGDTNVFNEMSLLFENLMRISLSKSGNDFMRPGHTRIGGFNAIWGEYIYGKIEGGSHFWEIIE